MIFKKLKSIIVNVLSIDKKEVTPTANLADIVEFANEENGFIYSQDEILIFGLDIEIDIEKKWGITFGQNDKYTIIWTKGKKDFRYGVKEILTVGELAEVIENQIKTTENYY
jgi:acyl carrier protein